MPKPHEVLGVPVGAPMHEITLAYRQLAKKHHPDMGGDMAKFIEIKKAYEALRTKDDGRGPFDDIIADAAAENKA